jgi:hypothetical protein
VCVAQHNIEQKFQKCHLHRIYYNICAFAPNRRYSVEQKPYCQYSVVSAEGSYFCRFQFLFFSATIHLHRPLVGKYLRTVDIGTQRKIMVILLASRCHLYLRKLPSLFCGHKMHDMAITENYSIFLDHPLCLKPEKMGEGKMPFDFDDAAGSR